MSLPRRGRRYCSRRALPFAALAVLCGFSAEALAQLPDPTARATQTADPLVDLNNASRMFYALAKQRALARSGPVLIVVGDDLVLRKGESRQQARVIPQAYHTLKTFDHIALALDVSLTAHAGEDPLDADFLSDLKDYRRMFAAAGEQIDKSELDAEQRARQKAILASAASFLDTVIDHRRCTPAERAAFTRRMNPMIMANSSAAARAALDMLHHQVSEWKKQLSPQEWSRLTVLVIGRQLPRRENLATQYFARLLNLGGEGPRLIYAEGLGDEPRALDLLATHLVDRGVGIDFFNDPERMERDLLSDAAKDYLPLLLDAPR